MPAQVTDVRSNANDQLVYAATALRRSAKKRTLFAAISKGRKHVRSATDLAQELGWSEKDVLTIGRRLTNAHLVEQAKSGGRVAYKKDPFYASQRERILRLAGHSELLAAIPTKVSSASQSGTVNVRLRLPRRVIRVERVTLDDIDSFRLVRGIANGTHDPRSISERRLKEGIQVVLGDTGVFNDWGGEGNDLYTTATRVRGRRIAAAFGLKGPGTSGVLTLAKLGKNGDQVISLFQSPADLFVIQYCGQIHEVVTKEVKAHAEIKSVYEQRLIRYAILNGDDTSRLLTAYPGEFRLADASSRGTPDGRPSQPSRGPSRARPARC